MNLKIDPATKIIFPSSCHHEIISHCELKLSGKSINGCKPDLKAYGLVGGDYKDNIIKIYKCLPLHENARGQEPYKKVMDDLMSRHAIPSETPFEKRGWVADPKELMARVRDCKENDISLIGTYHMHRVGWEHDPLRDTPTGIDTILGEDSRLIMFIVSMIDPCRPIIRAFYEGKKDLEIPVIFPDS